AARAGLEPLPAWKDGHAAHAPHGQAAHRDRLVRTHEHVEIDAVAPAGGRPVELPGLEAGPGAEDALAVAPHPCLDRGEALELLGRKPAVAHRAHVEEQVAALAGHLAQRVDQLPRRLPVRIARIVAPALVD